MKSKDFGWRCFHCDRYFHEIEQARLHFGPTEYAVPSCQIDAAQVRLLERQLAEYRAEDTELYRTINRLQSEHYQALRRAEEAGYAHCMRDITAIVPKLGGDPQALTRILIEFGGDRIPILVAPNKYKCPLCEVSFSVADDSEYTLHPNRGHTCHA
jgi:hypothetical protein